MKKLLMITNIETLKDKLSKVYDDDKIDIRYIEHINYTDECRDIANYVRREASKLKPSLIVICIDWEKLSKEDINWDHICNLALVLNELNGNTYEVLYLDTQTITDGVTCGNYQYALDMVT